MSDSSEIRQSLTGRERQIAHLGKACPRARAQSSTTYLRLLRQSIVNRTSRVLYIFYHLIEMTSDCRMFRGIHLHDVIVLALLRII